MYVYIYIYIAGAARDAPFPDGNTDKQMECPDGTTTIEFQKRFGKRKIMSEIVLDSCLC